MLVRVEIITLSNLLLTAMYYSCSHGKEWFILKSYSLQKIFVLLFMSSLPYAFLYGQDTIRVLALGNSFSEDALQDFLYPIGRNNGTIFIIGNLHISSASLEKHWENIEKKFPKYGFNQINKDGFFSNIPNCTIDSALTADNWDFVSLQQVSSSSGNLSSYFPYLPLLINYVREKALNPNVKIVFHQTWAYAQDAETKGFDYYGNSQEQMHDSILHAVKMLQLKTDIDKVVFAGSSIQAARKELGDIFCRDGMHLNALGRFTASCAWFQTLTGLDVSKNTFVPKNITEEVAKSIQNIVHSTVTELQNWGDKPLDTIQIDYSFRCLQTEEGNIFLEAEIPDETLVTVEQIYTNGSSRLIMNEWTSGKINLSFSMVNKGLSFIRITAKNHYTKIIKVVTF